MTQIIINWVNVCLYYLNCCRWYVLGMTGLPLQLTDGLYVYFPSLAFRNKSSHCQDLLLLWLHIETCWLLCITTGLVRTVQLNPKLIVLRLNIVNWQWTSISDFFWGGGQLLATIFSFRFFVCEIFCMLQWTALNFIELCRPASIILYGKMENSCSR